LKEGTEAVGNRVRVKVVKNKVAPPFRQAEFDIEYGMGISREGCILDLGLEHDLVQKSGSFFSYGDLRLGQGRNNSKQFLRNSPEVADEIEAKVREAVTKADEEKAEASGNGPKAVADKPKADAAEEPEVKASAPVAAAPAPKTKASAPAPTAAPAAPPAKLPTPATAATPPAATAAPTAPPAVPPATATTPPPAAADAAAGRFVVQVGAFAEPAQVRELRARLDKLGLRKHYVQAIEAKGGQRVNRVRLGPYGTRDEAERAAGRLKDAGLPGQVLEL
jgi:cell division septation protein DedD